MKGGLNKLLDALPVVTSCTNKTQSPPRTSASPTGSRLILPSSDSAHFNESTAFISVIIHQKT
jgi:hypothetical protein